jgi:hypothetical protein
MSVQLVALLAFQPQSAADAILRKLGYANATFRQSECLGGSPKQHRVTYQNFEVIVQEDGSYFSFRNLASLSGRRKLWESEAATRFTNAAKVDACVSVVANRLAIRGATWSRATRTGRRTKGRSFGDSWGTASIRLCQGAFGYETNGCGNSIALQIDLRNLQVSGASMQSGWTYRRPRIRISRERAVGLAIAAAGKKKEPTSISLKYVLPTWAFGIDRRRSARECVLGYECLWETAIAVVDAETGELIGGAKFL